jgi:hypothetical protein
MYQRIIAVLVGVLVFLGGMKGQSNEIKYDADLPESIRRIDFVNKKTKAIVSTYDVIANNPYNHLKYPIIEKKAGNKIYDIRNVTQKDVSYFVSKKSPQIIDFQPVKAISRVFIRSNQKTYTTVSYILITIGLEDDIDHHTTTKILDNDSKVIRTFEHLNYQDNYSLVSQDGKYYMLQDSGDAFDGKFNQVYRIYDVKTGQLLYEEERSGFDQNISMWSIQSGVFVREEMTTATESETRILDIENSSIATFTHSMGNSFSDVELLAMIKSVREDVKSKNTTNATFKIEKFNFYQNKWV